MTVLKQHNATPERGVNIHTLHTYIHTLHTYTHYIHTYIT